MNDHLHAEAENEKLWVLVDRKHRMAVMLAEAIRTFLGPTYHNRNHDDPCASVLCSALSEYDAEVFKTGPSFRVGRWAAGPCCRCERVIEDGEVVQLDWMAQTVLCAKCRKDDYAAFMRAILYGAPPITTSMSDRRRWEHGVMTTPPPCPRCGHEFDDHQRESWYDEEGIEGMTCEICRDAGIQCQWWTWDWNDVLTDAAMHDGPDQYPPITPSTETEESGRG